MEVKHNIYNLAFILFLCVGVLSSCIRDPHPGYDMTYAGNETEVMLRVGVGTGSGTIEEEAERIKTMRVIVSSVNGNSEMLVQNVKFTENLNTNARSYTINMKVMDKGPARFYVVCNEEALPAQTQQYLSGLTEGADLSGFSAYVVNDSGRSSFPKLRVDAKTNHVPITGVSQVVDLQDKREEVSFSIKYLVAKVVVDVTNNTVSQIQVQNFNVSRCFSDRAYLFPQEGLVKVPAQTLYETDNFVINGTYVESGEKIEGAMNLYIYPSDAGAYTVSMNGYEYIPFFSGTVLDRGVIAELNGIFGNNPLPEFDYKVSDWGTMDNDVPVFD